ncbi:MAG: hydroxymethylglutaryl-CoA synthase [Patescibacteria group bacterium]
MIGITAYGFYIPKNRITVEEIANAHGKIPQEISSSLQITEKAVAGYDEDTVTMAFEATVRALTHASFSKEEIDAVLFGSETHPYAVKPASTIIADWLDLGKNEYLAYDTQFACKAATGALLSAFSAVKAGDARTALVCGADKANARVGDALEYTAGSGAVSLFIGAKDVILEAVDYHSYASDTPDFWRRQKASHPSHGGRFTGKPAYFHHITESATQLLTRQGMKPNDFTHAVFHMPNGRFPQRVAQSIGFTKEQIAPSLVVSKLGNSYAASALMGLAATIEHLKPGDTVFFASYGSGAGSDAIIFRATEELMSRKHNFQEHIAGGSYKTYTEYLQFMHIVS